MEVRRAPGRPHFTTQDGLIGFPPTADITVEARDVILTDQGHRYQLLGPRLWGQASVLTGKRFSYYWLRAQAIV